MLTWWRHQMETFSALLAFCAGNSPVPGEFPSQRPSTRSFDVFFDLRLNSWVNNRDAGDLRRHRGHYDVTVMEAGQIVNKHHNFVTVYYDLWGPWHHCHELGFTAILAANPKSMFSVQRIKSPDLNEENIFNYDNSSKFGWRHPDCPEKKAILATEKA